MSDDIKNMGSLLSKMTAETSGEVRFTDGQVKSVMEVLLPRLATNMPGLPPGITCSVESDDQGWTLRINKPK